MWSLEALKFHVKLQHFKQGAWHSYFESQKFLVELWSLSHRLEKKRGVSVTEERLPGPVCGVQILYRMEIEGQDSDDPHLAGWGRCKLHNQSLLSERYRYFPCLDLLQKN